MSCLLSGSHQDELRYFIETIHDNVIKGNVQGGKDGPQRVSTVVHMPRLCSAAALQSLRLNKDGKFDFREFENLNKEYPSILYPCMRVQQNMVTSGLIAFPRSICASSRAALDAKYHGREVVEAEETCDDC